MPSRLSVPRIRVDFLDGSPRILSPSSTLDIRDILSQAKLFPNLFSERLAFDDADDALYLDDRYMHSVPPFPIGRRPPIFILLSHRTRLPFHIRTEAFEFGDVLFDDDHVRPLLTAPTIPRMKLMMKEQMYVQKWINSLTLDNPPKHIPWTCEKPAAGRDWLAQGSLFPAAVVKSSIEHHRPAEEHPPALDRNGPLGLCDRIHSVTEASAPTCVPHSRTSTSHVLVTSAHAGSFSRGTCRIARWSQAPSPLSLPPSFPPVGMTRVDTGAPLATRRGKSLSGLKLAGSESVIEQLEYPDIPTAFLGSPSVWSPPFDSSVDPSFTDHQTMISNLTSKCAALGNGLPTCIEETLCPQSEADEDEWAFARELATFENNHSNKIFVDTSVFLPCDSSTPPSKLPGLTSHPGFPALESMPATLFPIKSPCDPPADPLPPRPALVSPSTPPHVRGILKKVKSVRFEDATTTGFQNLALVDSLPQAFPEPPSPSAAFSETSCTSTPTSAEPLGCTPISRTPGSGCGVQEKKPAPRPRLPIRTKANGQIEPVHSNVVNALGSSKPALATSSVERPCRIAHAKENSSPAGGQVKQKGPITGIRRGLESPAKSRLSVPLRNIFRFK